MAYGFDGSELNLQPTYGRWVPRVEVGKNGVGHSIYPEVREYQLYWGLMPVADFDAIRDIYNQVSITGTVVASLPEIGASTYGFKNYSGCVVNEPEAGRYFTEHVTEVNWIIGSIRT